MAQQPAVEMAIRVAGTKVVPTLRRASGGEWERAVSGRGGRVGESARACVRRWVSGWVAGWARVSSAMTERLRECENARVGGWTVRAWDASTMGGGRTRSRSGRPAQT